MRRIRNPRYAPEFLERKLNPSTLAPTAEVSTYDATACAPTDATVDDSYIVADCAGSTFDSPGDPPPPPPDYPEDPAGPAYYPDSSGYPDYTDYPQYTDTGV